MQHLSNAILNNNIEENNQAHKQLFGNTLKKNINLPLSTHMEKNITTIDTQQKPNNIRIKK